MSFRITRHDDGGITCTGSGLVTGAETLDLNKKLYASDDDAIRRIRYQIIDLVDVSDFQISADEIQTLASQDARAAGLNPHMVIAIVVANPLTYGLNRMYQAYVDNQNDQVRLFTDMDAARDWIEACLQSSDGDQRS